MTRNEILSVRELHTAEGRRCAQLFIAEGEKLVGELLDSDLEVRHVYQTEPLFDSGTMVSCKEMERISCLKTPGKVLAVAVMPKWNIGDVNPGEELVLGLDCIQNPGNLGTIVRLADWFGIRNIICSTDTVDVFNPKVVQATMGALLRVAVHYTHLPSFLATCRCPIYGTFLEGRNIYSEPLSSTGIVVMGNEGKGISAECACHVTDKLFIPPFPPSRHGSESLNVSVATAIVCSEFRRR